MNQQFDSRKKAVKGLGWKEQLAEVRKQIIKEAIKDKPKQESK